MTKLDQQAKTKKQDWEKEFDKKFGEEYIISICENADARLGLIKPFIRTQIKKAKREVLEEIEIKKLKEENFDGRTSQAKHQIWVRGFNDAIDKLNKLKQEL